MRNMCSAVSGACPVTVVLSLFEFCVRAHSRCGALVYIGVCGGGSVCVSVWAV